MAAVIKIKRGTQAQLDAAAASSGLQAGELYLVDGSTLCVGTSTTAFSKVLNAANPVITGSITEGVYTLTDTTPALNPANGTIQTWVLTANSTPTNGFTASGQSMTLMIDDGTARTVTWPTMTWVGGAAPTLATTGYSVIALWRVGTTLYGAYLGAA